MPDTKPPFRFWNFFFSLNGRVSRLGVWAFILPEKALAWFVPYLIARFIYHPAAVAYKAAVHSDDFDKVQAMFPSFETASIIWSLQGVIFLFLLWPAFALTFKRLHDVGWRGLFALPILSPYIYNGIVLTFQIAGHLHRVNLHASLIFNALYYYTWALSILLAILPGNTETNRFGRLPTQPPKPIQDVF